MNIHDPLGWEPCKKKSNTYLVAMKIGYSKRSDAISHILDATSDHMGKQANNIASAHMHKYHPGEEHIILSSTAWAELPA